ncbi:RloB domain-containing protein [Anaerotruncus sp. X29]|nr:RloB domain-containing protein [Anaerotruncus sp. X29]
MARQVRKSKKVIYVFCEGKSEKEYAEYLRETFKDVSAMHVPSPASTCLFKDTKSKFDKDARFYKNAEAIDEIWFFFDAEDQDADQWEKRLKIIKQLRGLRKKPNIRVRLLMTSACVEYWFRLHYEMAAPALHTKADKENALHWIQQRIPGYKKGDSGAIKQIAANWPTAAQHGEVVLAQLTEHGMPPVGVKNSDERDAWLHRNKYTFTTVQEAIRFLESLRE